tara:strand:+ start:244 stop:417 length:174 start_codon:yes stop_codon:yes gene_type:complete
MKRDEIQEDIRVRMGMGAIEKIKEAIEMMKKFPPSEERNKVLDQAEKALKEAQEHLA